MNEPGAEMRQSALSRSIAKTYGLARCFDWSSAGAEGKTAAARATPRDRINRRKSDRG